MAITPPSDIVLDVARAADPEKYRAAAERLARLRAVAASTETFTLPTTEASVARSSDVTRPATVAAFPPDARSAVQTPRRLDAYGQFESFMLQNFIHSMLPSNATNVFGKGSAGEFWKSMLAEKMGDELARSGQIGIAQRLAAGPQHPARPAGTAAASPLVPPPSSMSTLAGIQPHPSEGPEVANSVVTPAVDSSDRS